MKEFWIMVLVGVVYFALFGNMDIPEEATLPFFLVALLLTFGVIGIITWIHEQITKKRGP